MQTNVSGSDKQLLREPPTPLSSLPGGKGGAPLIRGGRETCVGWCAGTESQGARHTGSLHNLTEALPGMRSSVKAEGQRLRVSGGKDLWEQTVQGYYWGARMRTQSTAHSRGRRQPLQV